VAVTQARAENNPITWKNFLGNSRGLVEELCLNTRGGSKKNYKTFKLV